MKKRRLGLNRETVRELTARDLGAGRGGTIIQAQVQCTDTGCYSDSGCSYFGTCDGACFASCGSCKGVVCEVVNFTRDIYCNVDMRVLL